MDSLEDYVRGSDAAFFQEMIQSLEQRFTEANADDRVIDINTLCVVKKSARSVTRSRSKAMNSDSGMFSNCSSSNSTSNSISGEQRFNILHDKEKQKSLLKDILLQLKNFPCDRKTLNIKYLLIKKSAQVLRVSPLPRNPNFRPIFIFYDENDFVATFILDIDKYTPWSYICEQFFGEENLALCQEIYEIISGQVLVPNDETRNGTRLAYSTSTPVPDRTNTSTTLSIRQRAQSTTSCLTNPSSNGKDIPLWHQFQTSYRRNRPSPTSSVLNRNEQLNSAKRTWETLNKNNQEAKVLSELYREQTVHTLGSTCFPRGIDVHPFFHLHESGELSVSFLYDNHEYSPWPAIIHAYFGSEILNLYRNIYTKLLSPPDDLVADIEKAKIMLTQSGLSTNTASKVMVSYKTPKSIKGKQTTTIEEIKSVPKSKRIPATRNNTKEKSGGSTAKKIKT